MESAREINKKLDEISDLQSQIEEIENEVSDKSMLKDISTGEPVTKEFVLNKGREQIAQITQELNQITNNGQNCREVFTNPYYINDFAQDKIIANEIKENKLQAEKQKQNTPNN